MSELSRDQLREAALTGVRWASAARVTAEGSAFAATVVLAHLIPPAELGRAAVALILNVLATILVWDGLGVPLVQREHVERHHLESAFATSLVAGALLTGTVLVLAPATAPLFGERTAELLRLMSPVMFIASLGVVPQSVLQRELNFKRTSMIEAASVVSGSTAAVVLAIAGLDGEAMVLGALTQMTISVFLANLSATAWLPRWRGHSARELVRFGAPAALASFAYQGLRNVDYAILGAQMSAASVGFYYRAFQLGVDYQRKISTIMLRLAFPLYSRTRDLADMRRLRARIVRVHAVVIFPFLGTFVALAPVLVPWLFGARWEPAVVPAQILAIAGMANAIGAGTGPLILASGHPRALLKFNLGSFGLYALVVALAAPFGLTAVSIVVAGFYIVVMLLGGHYFLLHRLVGIPLRHLWPDIGPATVSSVALLAVVVPLQHLLRSWELPALVVIATAGAAGFAVYVGVLAAFFRSAWRDLTMLVSKVLSPSPMSRERQPAAASQPQPRARTVQ